MDQNNLLGNMVEFNDKLWSRKKEDKEKKRNIFESVKTLYENRELNLNTFRWEIFPIQATRKKRIENINS